MITRVTVREFRGISKSQVFAPETLTVLTGRNGLGKTTFFDAIDWCLFGESSRLGLQSELIKNLYRAKGDPTVEVVLALNNKTVALERTLRGVKLDGLPITERDLAELLIVDPAVFPPYLRELGKQVRTVTYLPQDQIRDFVTASLTSERRALLRGLLGVPNAGVVESSIKRVRDHFSIREKELIEETRNLEQELSQLATTVEFDSTVDRDATDLLTSFTNEYGAQIVSVESLRVALEQDIATRERSLSSLERALSIHSEASTTIAQADKEIAELSQRRIDAVGRVAEEEIKLKESANLIYGALAGQQNASRDIAQAEARFTDLTAALSTRQRIDDLVRELQGLDSEREEILVRKSALTKSAKSGRRDLETTEKLADEHRAHIKLTQERAAIELRRTDLEQRLSIGRDDRRRLESELASAELALAKLTKEITDLATNRDNLSALYQTALSLAQHTAQITDLREKLIALIDNADSSCPLCGAEYGTHDRLRNHLANTIKNADVDVRLRDASDLLRTAETKLLQMIGRQNVSAAAVQECRSALEQRDRDLSQTQIQYDSLNQALRDLGQPSLTIASDDVLKRVKELRVDVEANEVLISQLETDLRSIENRRNRLALDIEKLRTDDKIARVPNVDMKMVTEARERAVRDTQRLEESEQALRTLRMQQAISENRLSDVRSQIAGIEGRLGTENERKRRILEDFDRQCKELGVGIVDVRTGGDELRQSAGVMRSEIVNLRDTLARAKTLERRQVANENVVRQGERQAGLARAREQLSLLLRAKNRFKLIAENLETRSRLEADSAGTQHLAAIQDCVNDLYPHRHLNEIDIDFAEGELLVKDQWLTKGVRPQDFSSTGQANVLALSVFLGLALRQTFSLGRFLLLDEPVQNLDDLHFLAFLTLVKRVALSRQVIISTADSNVAAILRRQLNSWAVKNRTWCEYEWEAFQPESGPVIRRHDGKLIAVA
jgi:DNA repair exonuclease SbcCD ATPase subunit